MLSEMKILNWVYTRSDTRATRVLNLLIILIFLLVKLKIEMGIYPFALNLWVRNELTYVGN